MTNNFFSNHYKVLFFSGGGVFEEYGGSLRTGKQENLLDISLLPDFKIRGKPESIVIQLHGLLP